MNENYKEFTFNIGNTGFNFYFAGRPSFSTLRAKGFILSLL